MLLRSNQRTLRLPTSTRHSVTVCSKGLSVQPARSELHNYPLRSCERGYLAREYRALGSSWVIFSQDSNRFKDRRAAAIISHRAGIARVSPPRLRFFYRKSTPLPTYQSISRGKFLRESAAALAGAFPQLPILPVEGDFTSMLAFPESMMRATPLFLGFDDRRPFGPAAVDLLRAMADILGSGSMLLIGIDHALMLSVTPFLHPQRHEL
jgi:hypothetical protein